MENPEDVEKVGREDIGYSALKVAIGMVPVAGPVFQEWLPYVLAPPIESRRARFMEQLHERIKWLEENRGLNIEELANNEVFVDVVLNAAASAQRTSEEAKREALKNAVTNTALQLNPDITKTHIFLRYIDSLTEMHLIILSFFRNPTKWFSDNNRDFPAYMMGSLFGILTDAYPKMKAQDKFVEVLWTDLNSYGLVSTSSLRGNISGDGLRSPYTSSLGNEFLNFITFDQRV